MHGFQSDGFAVGRPRRRYGVGAASLGDVIGRVSGCTKLKCHAHSGNSILLEGGPGSLSAGACCACKRGSLSCCSVVYAVAKRPPPFASQAGLVSRHASAGCRSHAAANHGQMAATVTSQKFCPVHRFALWVDSPSLYTLISFFFYHFSLSVCLSFFPFPPFSFPFFFSLFSFFLFLSPREKIECESESIFMMAARQNFWHPPGRRKQRAGRMRQCGPFLVAADRLRLWSGSPDKLFDGCCRHPAASGWDVA